MCLINYPNMSNRLFMLCIILAVAVTYVECGVSRSSRYHGDNQQQQQPGQVVGRKNPQTILRDSDTNGSDPMNNARPNYLIPRGLSAWNIITLIIIVILLGMAGYYGIMCYPLICRKEDHYSMMDAASTSSGGTPIRSTEYEKYEKQGNYSSRSTTPSKSHE